ncbi:MAG: thioredoxin family protein [Spirochaetales bacterium]
MDTLGSIDEWVEEHPLGLLVFTTPDCGVCNAIKPRLAELEREHELLTVRYVNTTESAEVAAQFAVFAVPVLALFVGGRETVRFARFFGMHELEEAISRYEWLLSEGE